MCAARAGRIIHVCAQMKAVNRHSSFNQKTGACRRTVNICNTLNIVSIPRSQQVCLVYPTPMHNCYSTSWSYGMQGPMCIVRGHVLCTSRRAWTHKFSSDSALTAHLAKQQGHQFAQNDAVGEVSAERGDSHGPFIHITLFEAHFVLHLCQVLAELSNATQAGVQHLHQNCF